MDEKGGEMSLTTDDLQKLRMITREEVSPVIQTLRSELRAESARLEDLIDGLALATRQHFEVVFTELRDIREDLSVIKEDLAVTKDFVKDHSFRIRKLEQRG